MLALFDRVEDASEAVSDIIAAGILPAALEMMDALAIEAVEKGTFPVGYPEGVQAVLLVEVDGVEAGLEEQIRRIVDVCRKHRVREVRPAASEEERASWWDNRKTAFGAVGTLSPDYLVQDGVIPRSRLPEVLARIAEIGEGKGGSHRQRLPCRRWQSASPDPVRFPGSRGNGEGRSGRIGHPEGVRRCGRQHHR